MPIIRDTQVINGQAVTIYIDVDDSSVSAIPYSNLREGNLQEGTSRVIKAARDVFGDGLELTRNCAARVVDCINSIDRSIRPNEFELQLAITLDAEIGAIIAKMGAEAQLHVSMKWIHKDEI